MQAFRQVRIGWRRKSAAFRLFDTLPGGNALYYLTQRYVTRTFPRPLAQHVDWAIEHAATFRRWAGPDLGGRTLFEFGAGWDLFNNLVMWCYGVEDQIVIDLRRWARASEINHALGFLEAHPPPAAVRVPGTRLPPAFEEPLRREYGIRYTAPADARDTRLPAASVDLICTTSVLEHVPPDALRAILAECRRIAKPGAVISHVIDYTDHYAHSDGGISIYNFLRFSDREWDRFNPGIHFQNRLRHFEYGKLFTGAGFEPRSVWAATSGNACGLLERVPLADRFRGMTPAQLLPRTGHWVLAPA